MKIRGYELRAAGAPLVLAERETSGPGPGQALIEVAGCGVCHTDLGFLYEGVPTRHPLPLVLGHEVAGTVRAAGPGVTGLVGRPVIVPAVLPCGSCELCRRGRGDICKAQVFPGNDDHGGFASHLIVPAHGLCPVPGPLERPALARLSVCADAVSTAYYAVQRSRLAAGDFAVFVGAGGVGGFGVQIARARGARVLAADVDDERLAVLAGHGAEWTLNARELGPRELRQRVRDLARGAGLPAAEWKIFETSGTAPGQEAAFGLLNHGATLMVVGFHPGEVRVRLSNLMAFAARAEGVWGCPPALYPEILQLVQSGRVALDPFIELHPMSAVNEILEQLRARKLRKRPILVPDFPAGQST